MSDIFFGEKGESRLLDLHNQPIGEGFKVCAWGKKKL